MKFCLVLFLIVAISGCKMPAAIDSSQNQDVQGLKLLSFSTPESGPGNSGQPVEVDLDSKTGKPRQRLILKLDYFSGPESKASARQIPSCLEPLDQGTELGFLICIGKQGSRILLKAGMVDQICYSKPQSIRTVGKDSWMLLGCHRALGVLHQFQPQVQIDVEAKEI